LLYFGNFFAALRALEILGIISFMGRHQVVVQWNRIWYELDNSCNIGEWQNSIGPDAEISFTSRLIGFKQFTNLLKHLLHDSILPQIIVTSFDLWNVSEVPCVYLMMRDLPIA
jgi:hypothetical protein